ncbi:MAG TPA: glycosidase [Syntrophomonas sp.]|nr:glycosidase [Syntrophomonas sp.]
MTNSKRESIFDEQIDLILPQLESYNNFDLLIGIPFYGNNCGLHQVLQSVDQVLQNWIGRRQLIVCIGDANAAEMMHTIENLQLYHPYLAFILPPEASGRGMSIRALLQIARKMEVDLLVFDAPMGTSHGPGINIDWLEGLLTPIQGQYDLVVSSRKRHGGITSIASLLAMPFLETFYGSRLSEPLGGIYAISHDFVEELVTEAKFWTDTIAGSGIDFWLITRALCWNKQICELYLNENPQSCSLERNSAVFIDVLKTIFACLGRDHALWLPERLVTKVVDILNYKKMPVVESAGVDWDELRQELKKHYQRSEDTIRLILPEENEQQLRQLMTAATGDYHLSNSAWVSNIYKIFLYYTFSEEVSQKDLLHAAAALFNAKIASCVLELNQFGAGLKAADEFEKDELVSHKLELTRQQLLVEFHKQKPLLSKQWLGRSEQTAPPLVPFGYMEYIPGRPIVVPKRISGKDKHVVNTDELFKKLRKLYEDRFNHFLAEGLGLPAHAEPDRIIAAMEKFMAAAERTVDEMFPGNLNDPDGMEQFVTGLFAMVPHQQMFTINTDLLKEMLIRFPPVNLMIPLGFYSPAELLANIDPRDAVTYANLVDSWSYNDRDLVWLTEQLKPESFGWAQIKPLIVNKSLPEGLWSHTKISNLNRLTARITIKAMEPGKGGKYPKLRYFTSLIRRICLAEHYSLLFQQNVKERKNVGGKARNSMTAMEKGDDFSAQRIFENSNHRALVEKIGAMALALQQRGMNEPARIFQMMADGYGLSQVLEDGAFLTCTVWSWASYSFKGGLNLPTPMTTSIENRWFNHEFLELLYKELGYDKEEILQTAFRYLQSGKSGHSLLDALLPARPKDIQVVVQETTNEPSKTLVRYEGNPLLEPIKEHDWECKYVLNPGAIRIKDKVYLFYRAVGEDNVSHIGLAITDGYRVLERLDTPIFSPATPEEKMGCEDPRLIQIGERIWMLYTAYDGNIAQIAAASISLQDFLARRFTSWKREGLAFKNIWDKDAILFPEKIKDRYILYHRIEPSMWITYMKDLVFPSREKHAIIIGPRPGRMWDSLKIGAGAQPIKTRYGWLLIYHGVDHNYVYRLGVILVDLENPQRVIYRSPNPVLEPIEDYELGLSGAWVPNVVFTCGAVAGTEKEVLEDEDEILVYYGAADTSIGMAKATLAEMIPEKFRCR